MKDARPFHPFWIDGYRMALLDVRRILEDDGFQSDLKLHKRRLNQKELVKLLDCLIESRGILRWDPDAFVRCNNAVEGGFELVVSTGPRSVERVTFE